MELLAPAGSMEALRAAVCNGADAVYLGADTFNARMNARNFSAADLQEAVVYCHVRGVKVHLTLNTLVLDREMPRAAELIRLAASCGVDAFIVQDLGVVSLCRQLAPDVPIHASTQMSIHSLEGVMEAVKRQFAEKLTREEFEQKLAFTAGSEKNLITRIIPLPLKNGILRIVYEHSNNGSTLVFSNLGPVRVEEPFRRYFEGFRFLLSTTPREPVKATACACGNTLALTFTTEVEDNRLARSVVRRLAKAGVPVTLETGGDTDETLQGV